MESIIDASLTIYPNPASNVLIIEANGSDTLALEEIIVHDLSGRNSTALIEKLEGTDKKIILDISKLRSGTYLISLNNVTTRVVVK